MAGMRNSRKWLCAGLVAAFVVGMLAVACGGGSDAAGPEQTVQAMMDAMSAKNVDAFVAVMDPEGIQQIEAMGVTEDQFKAMMAENFTYDSMEFSGVKMETEISEDGQTATVTITEGVVTTVENGETTVDDVKDSGEPEVFNLVLRDGKWYLDIQNMM